MIVRWELTDNDGNVIASAQIETVLMKLNAKLEEPPEPLAMVTLSHSVTKLESEPGYHWKEIEEKGRLRV